MADKWQVISIGVAVVLGDLAAPYFWPVLIVGVSIVVFGITLPWWRSRFPRIFRLSRAELRAKCKDLSIDIWQLLSDRSQDDPALGNPWPHLPAGASETQRHEAFVNYVEALGRHSTETMSRYHVRYSGKALALFDELSKRGWIDSSKRPIFEHPTNPLGIAEVAKALATAAERKG